MMCQPDTGPRARQAGNSPCRVVGGTVLDAVIVESENARVELLRRGSSGRIGWRFRQPSPTVVWFRGGVRRLRLDIDGERFEAQVTAGNPLCFFPAGATIEGEFDVRPVADYAVIFLDPLLAERYGPVIPDRPLIGLASGPIDRGLHDISRYARQRDSVLELSVAGWALQSLAHISRLGLGRHPAPIPAGSGLPAESLARVEKYVRDHLSEPLGIDLLAEAAGFSRRHFLRAFRQRTGQTPMHYVYSARLDEAAFRLANSDEPVTDIAAACGFSHAQHLGTTFRRATGLTPSQFRSRRQAGQGG